MCLQMKGRIHILKTYYHKAYKSTLQLFNETFITMIAVKKYVADENIYGFDETINDVVNKKYNETKEADDNDCKFESGKFKC